MFRPGSQQQKAHELETTPEAGQILDMILPRRDGGPKSARGVLAAFHSVPTFHACARLVAQKMADVSYFVSREGELVPDHPFVEIRRHPNPYFAGWTYRYLQNLYLDLVGEIFDLLLEGPDGRLERWPIPPPSVKQVSDGWEIRLGDFQETFPRRQVLHISKPNLLNPYKRGRGTGSVLSDEIEASESISKHIKSSFQNNARPDFIAYLPGAKKKEREKFKSAWMQRFQGPSNAGAPAVVSDSVGEDGFQLEELSRTIADMEGAELKKLEDQLVRRTWGISPELMGVVENSNRATIRSAKNIFGEFVLEPRVQFWKASYNHHLMPLISDDEAERVDAPSQIPEDDEAKREQMKEHPYAFTINEIRASAGEPPREGGDVYIRQTDDRIDEVEAGPIEGETEDRGIGELEDDTVIRLADHRQTRQEGVDDRAQQVAEALEPEPLRTDLEPEVEDKIREFTEATFGEFPVGVDADELFFMMDPNIRDYVEEFGAEQISDINDTTREQVTDLVDGALKEGKNPRDIKGDLENYVDETIPNRGEVIARTEMNKAQNWSRHQTYKNSGVVEHERWLAFPGARNAHALLGGQTVETDEAFEVPSGEFAGATAQHPGDFDQIELVAQCRCGIRAVFPEIEDILEDASTPAEIKRVHRVRRMTDADVKRSITEQRQQAVGSFTQAVVAAFERQFREFLFPAFDDVFEEEQSA